ncbi:MAG: enoyl-CoA hydratase-related protein, partial [Phenylobacterium sp.]|nr:enoyl-CoA hydratase-related protein [Phenylobacterium sp.]
MATPTFETLAYEVEDGIATITLNRPDKLNAFNTQMMKDMIAAFD